MFFTGISLVSVVVAAIAAFIAGWLWYSPWLFGKMYNKEMGWTEEQMKKGPKLGMMKSFGIVFIAKIVMTIVAAALVNSLFVVSFSQILILVLSLWTAFIVGPKLNDVLFGSRSWKYFLITIGQDLLSVLVIFIVISLFS